MDNLLNIHLSSSFLVVARCILQDVAATECLSVSAGIDQIKSLNPTARVIVGTIGATDVVLNFFKNYILIEFEMTPWFAGRYILYWPSKSIGSDFYITSRRFRSVLKTSILFHPF